MVRLSSSLSRASLTNRKHAAARKCCASLSIYIPCLLCANMYLQRLDQRHTGSNGLVRRDKQDKKSVSPSQAACSTSIFNNCYEDRCTSETRARFVDCCRWSGQMLQKCWLPFQKMFMGRACCTLQVSLDEVPLPIVYTHTSTKSFCMFIICFGIVA